MTSSNPSFVNGWMNVTVYICRRIQFSISYRLLMNRPTSRRLLLTRMAFFSNGILCIEYSYGFFSVFMIVSSPTVKAHWTYTSTRIFGSTKYFLPLLYIPTTKRRLGLNIAQSRRNEMLLRYRQLLWAGTTYPNRTTIVWGHETWLCVL